MKLSKFELLLWKLFLEAEHPMSIEELKERLPCCYVPEPVVFLAVECLIHKKILMEAGIHQSYTNGERKRTILYALTRRAQECEQQK